MPNDEHAIREVMARWRERAAQGDVQALLEMLADDVVFLTPGNAPFGREQFAAGFRQFSSRATIETDQDVKEVGVSGDLAYAVSHLRVTINPRDGGARMVNEGDVLSVFRREGGRWRLARDANLMPGAGKPDRV
jgi:uncharacterized protein (TIGR02246 family)